MVYIRFGKWCPVSNNYAQVLKAGTHHQADNRHSISNDYIISTLVLLSIQALAPLSIINMYHVAGPLSWEL